MLDEPRSVDVANRCIESGKKFGIHIEKFKAITPKDNPIKLLNDMGIDDRPFENEWCRKENAIGCFLSHILLHNEIDEDEIMVLEHDAIFKKPLVKWPFKDLVNIGKPSYSSYNKKEDRVKAHGIYPLYSKDKLLGTHAYIIKKHFAPKIIELAKIKPAPLDVFLNKNDFPSIQEYHPWPVEVDDNFTSIQKEAGCRAKHNWKKGITII